MESPGDEGLEKYGNQRNQDGCGKTEPVNLNLLI
jgi:hypothetical protein